MNIKNIIGVNLKKIRLKNNFSCYHLAKCLGKTTGCITNIETGARAPSLPLLFLMADFFQEDIRVFLTTKELSSSTVVDWNKHWPSVGKNIVRIRKAKGIRQYALAQTLDITVAFLCNIENGKCLCSLPILFSIAECLEVDICDLFVLQ